MKSKAFTMIEILIATSILFISTITLVVAYKQFIKYRDQLEKYENFYESVRSLVDLLLWKSLLKNPQGSGVWNGLHYSYKTEIVKEERNFRPSTIETTDIYSKGQYYIYLIKVTLTVAGQKFSFYKTEYRKVTEK